MATTGALRERRIRQLRSLRGVLQQIRHIPRALRLVHAAAPRWTLASLVLVAAQGVLPILTVYLTRTVVNALVAVVDSHGDTASLAPAAGAIAAMAAVLLAGELLGSLAAYVKTGMAEATQEYMNCLIHDQAISLDLRLYESPTYHDQLQRAGVDAIDRPLGLLDSLSSIIQNTITLAAMAGVLFTFAWWLPLVLFAGTLPALWVALRATWRYHQWRLRNTANQRRLTYYHYRLISDAVAAELRLFDLGSYFAAAYKRLRGRLRLEQLALSHDQMLTQAVASVVGLLTQTLALAWMAWRALHGAFGLGDLAMFYQAMNQGQRLMRNLLTGASEIYRNLLFLEDLFAFLDLRPALADPPPGVPPPGPLSDGVRVQSVSFRYPDSERTALVDFDLDIPAGQIVAIVGENGAGKSTMLKLLCRFYDPDVGTITWDGRDLRDMSQADLRRRITVLFQQPGTYHGTVSENIAFGDLAAKPTTEEIEAAARAAAAHDLVTRLPKGYETVLGRWFGTTDLSVGEWQRLALARAFVRQADLVILDEPTSAMDSWAEAEWMQRFRNLVSGRTALIITHRFTTAMQADIIHVMDQGRIVESGTHAELLALGGRYARSWRLQLREAGSASPAGFSEQATR